MALPREAASENEKPAEVHDNIFWEGLGLRFRAGDLDGGAYVGADAVGRIF
jgi:hypothetical protein